MFRSHAEGSRFAEPGHAFEIDRDELCNLGQEDVRNSRLSSHSRVRISDVQALDFLHNLLGDWEWRSVSGCR